MSITTSTLSYLQNPENITPMLFIEVPTTLGRTYQGYKRGGANEAKERICEESLGAVVWLFGAKAFNKMGDFLGTKVLKLNQLNTDVGKDSLRDPFYNVKDKKTATAIFKFSKISASAILSALALGFAVPKIKKAMTNALREKKGLEPIADRNGEYKKGWADKLVGLFIKNNSENKKNEQLENSSLYSVSFEKFRENTKNKSSTSFTGANALNNLLFISHNLENNTAWRLLSTDLGTTTGRTLTSRTKKEGVEYFARDSISSIAYIFAAPMFSGILRKLTGIVNVHPKASEALNQHLTDIVVKNSGSVENNFFSSKFGISENAKNILDTLKFSDDSVISLDEFNLQTGQKYSKKAELMSRLQPEFHDCRVLSRMQAEDILSDSYTSDPKFLKNAISLATKGKSDDKKSFISRNRLEKIRTSIDDCVMGLEKYAKKQGSCINEELINKYIKNLNRKNLAIHFAGIAFAASCLGIFIPKLQYKISDLIAGEGGFAGDLESDKKAEN